MKRTIKLNESQLKNLIVNCVRKIRMNEAVDGGWEVNDWEAEDAYNFAAEYFGNEDLNAQIIKAMSNEELAKCLAFIFRMNDFREWENRDKNDEEIY